MIRIGVAALATTLLAGCWEEPVRETLTVDLRQPRRVGLSVVIELESARELQEEPAARRAVEQAAADLFEGRHAWNERFSLLDCELETGGWAKQIRELRRYELAAECSDPGSLGTLLGDRQLVTHLSFEAGGGELRLVPTGGGPATRGDRVRLERELDGFTRAFSAYLSEARDFARRAERVPDRAALLWDAVLVQNDPDAVPELTSAEKERATRLLDAIGSVLEAFHTGGRQAESLDALARRVFDPLPMEVEVVPPSQATLEVHGLVAAEGGKLALAPRGIEGALAAFEGRWLSPDPAMTLLRVLRSGDDEPPALEPFVRGSIVRSDETPDAAALRAEIESLLAPPDELSLVWRRTG